MICHSNPAQKQHGASATGLEPPPGVSKCPSLSAWWYRQDSSYEVPLVPMEETEVQFESWGPSGHSSSTNFLWPCPFPSADYKSIITSLTRKKWTRGHTQYIVNSMTELMSCSGTLVIGSPNSAGCSVLGSLGIPFSAPQNRVPELFIFP